MAGSGARTYRWQHKKERAVEARRRSKGFSRMHWEHRKKGNLPRCLHTCLPTIMFTSLSGKSQPCKQPSNDFYPVALKISFLLSHLHQQKDIVGIKAIITQALKSRTAICFALTFLMPTVRKMLLPKSYVENV
jgi:hypothetical protein